MTIKITVLAEDPEGKALDFSFTSESGIFGNIVNTDTGCTAELYTRNVIGDGAVYITVTAKDEKKASDTWGNFNVGTGRSGPKVNLSAYPRNYMKPSADTEIVFSSPNEGYYQIVCDNSATEDTIKINYDEPVYMYMPSGDADNPKFITISVAGLTSTSVGRVKLPTDNAPNKVWLIFWDGLKQFDTKCFIINQDSIPPLFSQVTPAGEDAGVRANVGIVFNEGVLIGNGKFEVKDSANSDVTSRFNAPAVADNSVSLIPAADLDYYETYTLGKGDAVITDLAGNEFTGTITGVFTTQAKGELAAPAFLNADRTAGIISNTVFPYSSAQTFRAVYQGVEDGVSINYTQQIGSRPANPAVNYSKTSDELISFSKNTTVVATAFKKGYKPKTGEISVKIRTATPVINPAGTNSGDYYAGVYNSLDVTLTGSGEFKYSFKADGGDPADPSTLYGSPVSFSVHGEKITFKAQATDSNMEPSEIAGAGLYRIRHKTVPKTDTVTNADPSKMSWTGVAIADSEPMIVAVEDGSVLLGGDSNGYIWSSKNSGVDWNPFTIPGGNKGLGKWSSVSGSSNFGVILAAQNPGKIYTSTDSGVTWSDNTSPSQNWNRVISSSDGSALYAAPLNGQIYKKTTGNWGVISTSGSYFWMDMDISSEGVLYAVENNSVISGQGRVWEETDPGLIVVDTSTPNNYTWIACSNFNDTDFMAGVYAGKLWYTDDTWSNWTEVGVANYQWYCGVSLIGSTSFLAGVWNGGIYAVKRDVSAMDLRIDLNRNWKEIAVSSNLVVAAAYGDYLYTSPNAFVGGYSIQGPRLWTALASSPDGKYLAGAVYIGNVYYSNNYGLTWSKLANPSGGSGKWVGTAISSDGVKIAAADNLNIFVWSGSAWNNKNPDVVEHGFTGVSMTHDGNTIFASASNYIHGFGTASNLWISADYGDSWSNPAGSAYQIWCGTAMSSDGAVKAAIADLAFDSNKIIRIYRNGVWTSYTINCGYDVSSLSSVSVSSNGQYIAVTEKSGGIFISSTGGVTWAAYQTGTPKKWKGISISDSGQVVTAVNADGEIFTTYNGGSIWEPQIYAGSHMWNCLAASADGLDLIAGSYGGTNPVILK